MKNKICCCFTLAAGIVLSGIAIGNGVAIGMTQMSIARNPILTSEFLEILRIGLIVNLIPFALLIISNCICKFIRHIKNRKKCYDYDECCD